jgi:hypothetical protein
VIGRSSARAQPPDWELPPVEASLQEQTTEPASRDRYAAPADVQFEHGAFCPCAGVGSDQHTNSDHGVTPAEFFQPDTGEQLPPQPLPNVGGSAAAVAQQLEDLSERIKELETAKTAHEDATRTIIRRSLAERGSNINDHVVFGGVLESLTFFQEDFNHVRESDTRLDTAELDFEVTVNEWSQAILIMDYDPGTDFLFPTTEGDAVNVNRMSIRRGIVTIGNVQKYPLYATFGRDDVPFGIATGDPLADTLTINDPLTIEVFQTREDFIMLGFELPTQPLPPPVSTTSPPPTPPQVRPMLFNPAVRGLCSWACPYCGPRTTAKPGPLIPTPIPPPFHGAVYFYNGDTTNLGQNHIEQMGGELGYRKQGRYPEWRIPWSLDMDVDANSSVFDSDFLEFQYRHFLDQIGFVPGMAAHVKSSLGPYSLIVEWNGAISDAKFTDDAATPVSIRPEAWQVQLGYQLDWNPYVEVIGNQGTFIAIGYSESSDLAGVTRVVAAVPERVGNVPERRLLASVGEWVLDGLRIELEYAHIIDYSVAEGGTGNSANGVFFQVSYQW